MGSSTITVLSTTLNVSSIREGSSANGTKSSYTVSFIKLSIYSVLLCLTGMGVPSYKFDSLLYSSE
jgi:hypothetical protein